MNTCFYDATVGLTEIARIFTFGCQNRRDIVRRLMGTSDMFNGLTYHDAFESYRSAERDGHVKHGDGYIVVYADFSN